MPTCLLSTKSMRAIFNAGFPTPAGPSLMFLRTVIDCLPTAETLPSLCEVRRGDQMKGGVALKAAGCDVSVHPYLFRLVCRNGAIRAHAIQTRRINISEFITPPRGVGAICKSVRACCLKEAFVQGVREVLATVDASVDFALQVAPVLSLLDPATATRLYQEIAFRFSEDPKRSGFALMNAITSVARDTRDADLRLAAGKIGRRITGPAHTNADARSRHDTFIGGCSRRRMSRFCDLAKPGSDEVCDQGLGTCIEQLSLSRRLGRVW